MLEIERRFRLSALPPEPILAGASKVRIIQHYVADTGGWVVRVRKTVRAAPMGPCYHLTMKRPAGAGFASHEIETEIDSFAYTDLIHHTDGAAIEKTRWSIPHGLLLLEIDRFDHPALGGLVIMEVELPDEDHGINMPAWFQGVEVTGDRSLSNYALSKQIAEARKSQLRPA